MATDHHITLTCFEGVCKEFNRQFSPEVRRAIHPPYQLVRAGASVQSFMDACDMDLLRCAITFGKRPAAIRDEIEWIDMGGWGFCFDPQVPRAIKTALKDDYWVFAWRPAEEAEDFWDEAIPKVEGILNRPEGPRQHVYRQELKHEGIDTPCQDKSSSR